jgi:hypothetical protein
MDDVVVAAGMLKIDRDVVGIMPFAAPSGISQSGAVRASAAIHFLRRL